MHSKANEPASVVPYESKNSRIYEALARGGVGLLIVESPTIDYLEQVLFRALAKQGAKIRTEVLRESMIPLRVSSRYTKCPINAA
jgi:hypothetical protein